MNERQRNKGSDRNKDALKITHQSRGRGGGMLYGLKSEGVHLTLLVSQRAGDADEGEWLIEARSKRAAAEDVVAAEWGATRIEALRAVGRSWDSNVGTHGLNMFDWEAVARVLSEVRAL